MIGRTGTTKPDVGWRAFLSCRPPRSSLARSALLSARFGKQPHKTRLNFSGAIKCLNKGLPPLRREYELALVCNRLLSLQASALQNKIGDADALCTCARANQFLLRFGCPDVQPSRSPGPLCNCLGHPITSSFVHTLYVSPALSSKCARTALSSNPARAAPKSAALHLNVNQSRAMSGG